MNRTDIDRLHAAALVGGFFDQCKAYVAFESTWPAISARLALLEEIVKTIKANGEFDDGCFYYNRHSAPELQQHLQRYSEIEANK